MNTANYLSPLAQPNRESRLLVATGGVLMLLALCVVSIPMTLVWLADHLRGAQ